MVLGEVVLEFHQDVDGFIKLLLTDTETEELKCQALLYVKRQLKVEL